LFSRYGYPDAIAATKLVTTLLRRVKAVFSNRKGMMLLVKISFTVCDKSRLLRVLSDGFLRQAFLNLK